MKHNNRKFILTWLLGFITLFGTVTILLLNAQTTQARSDPRLSVAPLANLYLTPRITPTPVPPFLYPPYPGMANDGKRGSIFDHHYPYYGLNTQESGWDDLLYAPNGYIATCMPTPDHKKQDCIFEINNHQVYLSYDNHDGIDYMIDYVPIYAAANGWIEKAEWASASNHTFDLGLYVKMGHDINSDNVVDYYTFYGHLSATSVTKCNNPQNPNNCPKIWHGNIIGISGSTGNSDGPHLHLTVDAKKFTQTPAIESNWYTKVDPYGWYPWPEADVTEDPQFVYPYDQIGYAHQQVNSLWVVEPRIGNSDPYYPLPRGEGNELPFPTVPPLPPITPTPNATQWFQYGVIDDYADEWGWPLTVTPPAIPNFGVTPAGCWNPLLNNKAIQGALLYRQQTGSQVGTCSAKWLFPSNKPSGRYAVYIHIPTDLSLNLAESVQYEIQSGTVKYSGIIDMSEIQIAGDSSDDPTIKSGWVYIGSYYFSSATTNNYIMVTNNTGSSVSGVYVVVDAARFAPVAATQATPTEGTTRTPTPTITLTPTPTVTPSATPTYVPGMLNIWPDLGAPINRWFCDEFDVDGGWLKHAGAFNALYTACAGWYLPCSEYSQDDRVHVAGQVTCQECSMPPCPEAACSYSNLQLNVGGGDENGMYGEPGFSWLLTDPAACQLTSITPPPGYQNAVTFDCYSTPLRSWDRLYDFIWLNASDDQSSDQLHDLAISRFDIDWGYASPTPVPTPNEAGFTVYFRDPDDQIAVLPGLPLWDRVDGPINYQNPYDGNMFTWQANVITSTETRHTGPGAWINWGESQQYYTETNDVAALDFRLDPFGVTEVVTGTYHCEMYNRVTERAYTVSGTWDELGVTRSLLDDTSRLTFDIIYRCSAMWTDIEYWNSSVFRVRLDIYAFHQGPPANSQFFEWNAIWYKVIPCSAFFP